MNMHHENWYINQNNENMHRSRILAQPQAAFPASGKAPSINADGATQRPPW